VEREAPLAEPAVDAGVAAFAARPILAVATGVAAVLIAVSARYGYHRDEMYFLAAGRHLAWGYPDQPPLVPLLARAISAIAPGSLTLLRLPSAVAAGAIVFFTGLTTRELGGRRSAQILASVAMAGAAVLLGAGHLLSTATFDLLAWSALLWLIMRFLRTDEQRLWVVVGLIAGIGLLDSDLVAFLIAAVLVGIALTGPRPVFRSPWLWIGGVVAAAMWSPYLFWQAGHGWPELQVSRAIASGGSGTSTSRPVFVLAQFGLVSPYLSPVWVVGLARLLRDPSLRRWRAIGWAYVVLVVVFFVTGGKPYYLAGMFPVLLAAGATPTVDWLGRGQRSLRRAAFAGAVVLTAVESIVITLPVVPVADLHRTSIVAANYDTGETVAWPTYVKEVAAVYQALPAGQRTATAIVTSNYGEAGAVDRYGPALGLPHAFSGQTGYWYWGPPPPNSVTVVAVGFDRAFLDRSFADVRIATHLHNTLGISNDEQDAPIWLCARQRASWPTLWPRFRHT
jgi:4-amino-4-deoxy-L-arabinose transferase-like glycosyltransferase